MPFTLYNNVLFSEIYLCTIPTADSIYNTGSFRSAVG